MYCSKCGHPLTSPKSRFCSWCGAPLEAAAAANPAPPEIPAAANRRQPLAKELAYQPSAAELERGIFPPASAAKAAGGETAEKLPITGPERTPSAGDEDQYDLDAGGDEHEIYEPEPDEEDEAYIDEAYTDDTDGYYDEDAYDEYGEYDEEDADDGQHYADDEDDDGQDAYLEEEDSPNSAFRVTIPGEALDDSPYDMPASPAGSYPAGSPRYAYAPAGSAPTAKKGRKKLVIAIIAAALVVCALAAALYFAFGRGPSMEDVGLTLVTDEIEAGSEIDLLAMVKLQAEEPGRYTCTVKDGAFESTSVGEHLVTYLVTDSKSGKEKEIPLTITVVDTTPPEITCEDTIHVTYGDTFNILAYVHASDNAEGAPGAGPNSTTGDHKTHEEGVYPITITVIDASGNTATKDIEVEVASTGTPEAFFDKITGYWYPSAATGKSDINSVYIFTKENGTYYYKGFSWSGVIEFDFVNNDSTAASGAIRMQQDGQSWTMNFSIDTGTPADGKMEISFNGGSTFEVRHIGSTWPEALDKLGLTSFFIGGETDTGNATNGLDGATAGNANGNKNNNEKD